MFEWLTPVCVAVLFAAISLYSRRERDGVPRGGVFTMSRSLIITILILGLICLCLAGGVYFFGGTHPKSDALPVLDLAAVTVVCASVWHMYVVRLNDSGLTVELFRKRSVPYDSIARIVEIRNEKSPRAILVTRKGKKIGIWANLEGFDALVQQLSAACPSARHERLERGAND